MKYLILFLIGITLGSCIDKPIDDKLAGTWKVIKYKVNVPGMPQSIVKFETALNLASTYTFKTDKTYQLSVKENIGSNPHVKKGYYTINNKYLTLSPTFYKSCSNEKWKIVEQTNQNSYHFATLNYLIKKTNPNTIALSLKTQGGTKVLTLKQISQ